MSEAIRPADDEARRRALDPSASFVVQAPAGSGKTELLVRRFLVLLAAVERPEAVLSVTFTRKAAGEMRERVLGELRRARDGEPAKSEHEREGRDLALRVLARSEQKGWDLVENPSRLAISTIDALASSLAHSLPLLSGSGQSPEVTEDSRPLLVEAARRALASGDPRVREAVDCLAGRGELRIADLEEQIVAMLGRREQWGEGIAGGVDSEAREGGTTLLDLIEKNFATVTAEVLARAETLLGEDFAAQAEAWAAAARANFADPADCPWPTLGDTASLARGCSTVAAWREAHALLLTQEGSVRKSINVNNGAPPKSEAKEKGQALLADLKELEEEDRDRLVAAVIAAAALPLTPTFSEEGRAALRALFLLLLEAWGALQQVFALRGAVDFSEVGLRALQALGREDDPSDLLLRLDRRVDHILVDEFQDTNFLQCRLLSLLTSGWEAGDGRTLFLVGDPMQSIYRFRKAEVGLFVQARAGEGFFKELGLEPLRLSVSFRSDRALLDWVNENFGRLFGNEEDARTATVAYAPFDPAPSAEDGCPVELLRWRGSPVGEASEDEAEPLEPGAEAEARGLAGLIAEALEAGAPEIAVLVRTRNNAAPLMRALASLAIPYSAAGVETLGQRGPVRDLDALARALLHPADRVAWLALLHSPLVGMSGADLCALVEPDVVAALEGDEGPDGRRERRDPRPIPALLRDRELLATLGEDARCRAERAGRVVAEARRELGRRPVSAVVRAAWLELGGPLVGDLADADAYLAILEEASPEGLADLDSLARRLEGLAATADRREGVRVYFLTMHAAKGLEFDTVILPRLEAGSGRSKSEALAIETDPTTARLALLAPQAERGSEDPDKDKYKLIVGREAERGRAESLRLLYVAATRAQRRLILSSAARPTKKAWGKAPKNSLLGAAQAVIGRSFDALEPVEAPALAGARKVVGRRVRSAFAWSDVPEGLALAPVAVVTASATGTEPRFAAEAAAGSSRAAAFGRVVHAWLDRIARQGLEQWTAAKLAERRAVLRRDLRAEGLADADLDTEADRALAMLTSTLEDETGRRILGAGDEARAEWPLVLLAEGRVLRTKVDRSYVEDGVRWVVDYKTATPPSDARQREEWLAGEREHHRRQLEIYREAVSAAQQTLADLTSDLPVRTALYYPALPVGERWVEIL
jgi:ATP-dependent helicase/nuclease subunit A